jgi:EAL domain-containing protein (putative c-di-GMP-specific phosphodiesterase class I)
VPRGAPADGSAHKLTLVREFRVARTPGRGRLPHVVTTPRLERRTGWALPPQPPESWVGSRWTLVLLAALALAAGIPLLGLRGDPAPYQLPLALLHGAAGCAAVLTAYVLLIQQSVTGDARLRWMACGYVAVWPLVLLRSAELGDVGTHLDRGALVGLIWLLVLPLLALTSGDALRRSDLVVVPLLLLAALAAAVLLLPELPPLVTDDQGRTGALRAVSLALAGLGAVAAVLWHRTTPTGAGGTWTWVSASLVLGALAGLVLAAAERRLDDLWWAGQLLLLLALVVPAAGLSLVSATGYRRQSRRWRQLVSEVADLRAASPLLPGLSVSPEDDEGLPSERDVRTLIEAGMVKVALQPVVQLEDGAVVGFEALSRFGGRVPTDRWFRGASRCGLGGELERLTLKEALALLPGLPPDVFLAVNVSPAALEDDQVLVLLHESDLARVVVEVTEHEAVADYVGMRGVLERLRRAGARIAVDDTGAGFASLRHVLMLQPDVVKLDTSLSRAVHHDERQRKLVTALLTFAREVGSVVLAEGIETEEQLDALRDLGMPLGQGWHLGVPTIVT